MAFANMEDYIGIDDHGLPYVDFSNVTRRQLAAVTQLTSETYYESQGDKSVPVKRVRFALGAKNKSIEQLYKLMGFAPPEKIHVEVTGTVRYTVEELRARARQIAEGIIEAEVESWRAGD
jgi:phage terminase small subunit